MFRYRFSNGTPNQYLVHLVILDSQIASVDAGAVVIVPPGQNLPAHSVLAPQDVAESFPERVRAVIAGQVNGPAPFFNKQVGVTHGHGPVGPFPGAEKIIIIARLDTGEILGQCLLDRAVDHDFLCLAGLAFSDRDGVAHPSVAEWPGLELEKVADAEPVVDAEGEKQIIVRPVRKQLFNGMDVFKATDRFHGDARTFFRVVGGLIFLIRIYIYISYTSVWSRFPSLF